MALAGETRQQQPDWGEWSGRVRSISMHRGYDDAGAGSGDNTAVGLHLKYEAPAFGGLRSGLAYDFVEELHRNGSAAINLNDPIRILTEAWLQTKITDSCRVTVGRQAVNGEIFREDVFRHKSRSVEALLVQFDGWDDVSFAAGHALRMSNWLQFKDMGEFNDFGEVFRGHEDSAGLTWAEAVYSGLPDWQLALFGCQVDEIARLAGSRARWKMSANTAWSAFFRHEEGDGHAAGGADAFGVAWNQRLGPVDMEVGSFSVRGRRLLFDALTTGINHPLGSLMLICESPYDSGADSGYLRATCQFDKLSLYALYAYTAHDHLPFHGHEINLVATQKFSDQWSVSLKFGYGLRLPDAGGNQQLTDSRFVLNYEF